MNGTQNTDGWATFTDTSCNGLWVPPFMDWLVKETGSEGSGDGRKSLSGSLEGMKRAGFMERRTVRQSGWMSGTQQGALTLG